MRAASSHERTAARPSLLPHAVVQRSFAFLSVSALLSRGLPFVVNVAVARRLTPSEFGVSVVHFALVSTVVLTVREPFRRACLRGSDRVASWLVLPTGFCVASVLSAVLHFSVSTGRSTAYGAALQLHCLAGAPQRLWIVKLSLTLVQLL